MAEPMFSKRDTDDSRRGKEPSVAAQDRLKDRWPLWMITAFVAGMVAFSTVTILAVLARNNASDNAAKPAPAQGPSSQPATLGGPCPSHDETSVGVDGTRYVCKDGTWAYAQPAYDEPIYDGPPSEPTPTLSVGDFRLSIRVKAKECFGSAGCLVEFAVEVGITVPTPEHGSWELTYQVTGPEDGPLIDTTEITGSEYTVNEHTVTTPRRSTKLRIKPIDIAPIN